MKLLTILLICFSFNAMAVLDDEVPQMDCKRTAGKGNLQAPDIIRCENKKEVCFIYPSIGLSCYQKKDQ